ncbi:MAG: hypothetical protein AAFV53_21300 [Myxococcota bacterium]
MALVTLSHGTAVNPESLKYITLETKPSGGGTLIFVTIKLDDNSEHYVTTFEMDERDKAIALIKSYAKKINEADE